MIVGNIIIIWSAVVPFVADGRAKAAELYITIEEARSIKFEYLFTIFDFCDCLIVWLIVLLFSAPYELAVTTEVHKEESIF